MSNRRIAELSGMTESNLSQIIRGKRGASRGFVPVVEIHRDTEAAILGVRPEKDPPARGGARMSPVGARRRLQALARLGFPLRHLSEGVDWGIDPQPVHRFITGKSGAVYIMHSTHRKVCELYDKLHQTDPLDLGYSKVSVSRARASAVKNGYAPPSCWDVDTIDDPDAIPEWTGRCGTPLGNRIHQRDGIPMCDPYREAGPLSGYPGFVPARLRRLRTKAGLTLREIQEASGVHARTINGWELGHYAPRYPRLDEVLVVLNATVEDVTEEET
jgi:transcriptional regulator with XRE-family HTH domain